MSKCSVVVRGLRKVYPGGVVAVDEVDLDAERGLTAIMGPNGSGKTTTLSIIVGSLRPTRGRVEVCGIDVWGPEGWRARRCIGYASQDLPFREKLNTIDNLVWYGLIRGMSLFDARSRAKQLLEELGLVEAQKRSVQSLSGGMRRKLVIAAALIGDPEVLVLDEPTSGLDPGARLDFWDLLVKQVGDRVVLFSTHIPQEAEKYSDTTYIFHRGRVVARGQPRELIRRYAPATKILVVHEASEPPVVEGLEMAVHNSRRTIYYAEDPEEALPRIVEAFVKSRIHVSRIEVTKPGLEDVFYTVTGKTLEEAEKSA